MSVLAVLLAAVGVTDLIRRRPIVSGLVVVVAGLLLVGAGWHTLWLAPLLGVVVVVWTIAADNGTSTGFALLAAATLVLIVLSGELPLGDVPIQGWYDDLEIPALATVPFTRAALGLGVVLFLTNS
ncbi:MAG: hypothetical protein QOJ72_2343, partial [Nocardioidaceae bacterium]|nr:hypothetical protein [Nocardioidaceae bacterium]